jgi:hypothetical protein
VPEEFKTNAAARLPQRLLLIDPDIQVTEVSAGALPEPVAAWRAQASANARLALNDMASRGDFVLVAPGQLDPSAQANLDEHRALYQQVAASAIESGRNPTRSGSFDFSLGPGLAEVGRAHQVPAALFVVGEDYVASAGRTVMSALSVLLGVVPMGLPSFVSAGVVELESGRVLWFSHEISHGKRDLRNAADLRAVLEHLLSGYAKPSPPQ